MTRLFETTFILMLICGLLCACSIEGANPDSQIATIENSSHNTISVINTPGINSLTSTISPTLYKIEININFQQYEITDLVNNADIIGIGEITEKYPSQWTTNNGKAPNLDKLPTDYPSITIISDIQFKISDIIKGANDNVRIRIIGGRVDNVEIICDATPEIKLGKKYLLFMSENTGATKNVYPINYLIVGGYQGAFLITDELALQKKTRESWKLKDIMKIIEDTLKNTQEN